MRPSPPLLERDDALAALDEALDGAAAGRGAVVLVAGEAGIGKTTLLRAFVARAAGRARVLAGACDDLIAPRTLGALHDAAAGTDGPLAAALAGDGPADVVLGALLAELAGPGPTVLVVEDVHWADDATLDALLYAARRIEPLGALLVLAFRDGDADPSAPLARLLGALAAGPPVRRLALEPLSREAVAALAAGSAVDAAALHRVTAGNPFFVAEVLAAEGADVPESVVEAVRGRVGRLSPACRAALEQLSVVPSRVRPELAAALLGDDVQALAEAEAAGILEVGPASLGFRHELARRAVERGLGALRRRALNARVLELLRGRERPDRASLMHFAVAAGDVAGVLEIGPAAAREAARAGAHRQALAHLEAVRPHVERLPEAERAAVLDDLAWERYNAHRFGEAIDAGREAAALFERLDDPTGLARCLVRLSRHLFMAGETDEADACADRAVTVLEPVADPAALASASLYRGVILALTDAPERAASILELARELADRAGDGELAALAANYAGIAAVELGDPGGLALVRGSVAAALDGGHHEAAARGYCNVAELLCRSWATEALDAWLAEGLPFTRERGFWSHAYNLDVHRCVVLLRRGELEAAVHDLRRLVEGVRDPGMLYAYSVPWLGRALARQGDPAAGGLLAAAWERARRQRLLLGVAYAGLARVEWAWLSGRPDVARAVGEALAPRLAHPGAAPFRAELARWLARCGEDAAAPAGAAEAPAGWTLGLRGDHAGAAAAWAAAGAPYEQALELTEAAGAEAAAEGLGLLDAMGAAGAAARVRAGLRAAGVSAPRGPRPATRANPAGLTSRQLDVLELMVEGLTNVQIAERLVLSVRTVDHHVAAVLDKLGVRSRREAEGAARALGLMASARP